MKLGVLDLVPVLGESDSAHALKQSLLLAQTAERLGYERYWVAEHHDLDGLACTAPEVLLAHIGAQTSTIRLGSGALLLPHYKPLKVAETFHMLASLYPGRVDLGLGRAPGGSAHTTIALSGNFLENVRQLPDALQSLMRLLAGNYEIDGHSIAAKPVPAIPPEVWMLGTNQKSAAYAAQFGTGYVFGQFMSDQDALEVIAAYRRQFKESTQLRAPRVIVAVGVICADTDEEARQLAAERLQPPGMPLAADPGAELSARMIAGSAATVGAQLGKLRAAYEVDEFLLVTPIQDYAKRLRSHELIASIIGS